MRLSLSRLYLLIGQHPLLLFTFYTPFLKWITFYFFVTACTYHCQAVLLITECWCLINLNFLWAHVSYTDFCTQHKNQKDLFLNSLLNTFISLWCCWCCHIWSDSLIHNQVKSCNNDFVCRGPIEDRYRDLLLLLLIGLLHLHYCGQFGRSPGSWNYQARPERFKGFIQIKDTGKCSVIARWEIDHQCSDCNWFIILKWFNFCWRLVLFLILQTEFGFYRSSSDIQFASVALNWRSFWSSSSGSSYSLCNNWFWLVRNIVHISV